jgi:hypothetical protein
MTPPPYSSLPTYSSRLLLKPDATQPDVDDDNDDDDDDDDGANELSGRVRCAV